MSAEELTAILQTIAAAPPLPPGCNLEQAREAVEAMMAKLPVMEDLRFENDKLNGVPVLRSRSPAAERGMLFYLHGGGYVLGSAWGFRALIAEIGRQARAPTVSIDYRLAPEHPFPAALDDALAAYRALLDQGINTREIAVVGDSAGAGLALATLLSIRDAALPLPGAALLISPWIDLECTGETAVTKAAVDPVLRRGDLLGMASSYLQSASARQPLVSPLYADLAGLPPLLIQVGTAEILLDDALRLTARAAAADLEVTLQTWPRMFHGWQSRSAILGEAREAIQAGGSFLAKHLKT